MLNFSRNLYIQRCTTFSCLDSIDLQSKKPDPNRNIHNKQSLHNHQQITSRNNLHLLPVTLEAWERLVQNQSRAAQD